MNCRKCGSDDDVKPRKMPDPANKVAHEVALCGPCRRSFDRRLGGIGTRYRNERMRFLSMWRVACGVVSEKGASA